MWSEFSGITFFAKNIKINIYKPKPIHLVSSLFLIWRGFRKYVFGSYVFIIIFLSKLHPTANVMFITEDFTRV